MCCPHLKLTLILTKQAAKSEVSIDILTLIKSTALCWRGSLRQDSALAATSNGLTGLKFWLSGPLTDNENPCARTTTHNLYLHRDGYRIG